MNNAKAHAALIPKHILYTWAVHRVEDPSRPTNTTLTDMSNGIKSYKE